MRAGTFEKGVSTGYAHRGVRCNITYIVSCFEQLYPAAVEAIYPTLLCSVSAHRRVFLFVGVKLSVGTTTFRMRQILYISYPRYHVRNRRGKENLHAHTSSYYIPHLF
ncbi:hypothetical protein AVEN_261524-1 [Araneus ventricosus]|uniref:Uncharacterized protein n=1 Tax=Araneus ventricosus TaxID=182803 RepID=A0A4Y2RD51_ARAVE|nr:hypothetical protein AVEN_261524-1 [Araneus ventricosus]